MQNQGCGRDLTHWKPWAVCPGSPRASGRSSTRPRATSALTCGTTLASDGTLVSCSFHHRSESSQANITFITDFFFSLPACFYQNSFIKSWVMWIFLHPTCFSASKPSPCTTLSSCVAGSKALHRTLCVCSAGEYVLLPHFSSSFSFPLLLVHPKCLPCPGNCSEQQPWQTPDPAPLLLHHSLRALPCFAPDWANWAVCLTLWITA